MWTSLLNYSFIFYIWFEEASNAFFVEHHYIDSSGVLVANTRNLSRSIVAECRQEISGRDAEISRSPNTALMTRLTGVLDGWMLMLSPVTTCRLSSETGPPGEPAGPAELRADHSPVLWPDEGHAEGNQGPHTHAQQDAREFIVSGGEGLM